MSENNQSLEEFLFELAVQKPTAAERAAFLDNVCRDNPALRAYPDEPMTMDELQAEVNAVRSEPRARP